MYFVVLNGAPGSGKDTLGDRIMFHLMRSGHAVIWGRIKDVLYKATFERYGLTDYDTWVEICNDPDLKEEPLGVLDGKTPRDVLKYESEQVIKVVRGETGVVETYMEELVRVYGDALRSSIIVFTDGGFQSETDWLRDVGLPFSTPIIVRICRSKRNFLKDTREYLAGAKYIFWNCYGVETLDTMASIIADDITGLTMKKQFVQPAITMKHRFRAALASALMLKEGSIKFYEVGIAYKTNLRFETKRKW